MPSQQPPPPGPSPASQQQQQQPPPPAPPPPPAAAEESTPPPTPYNKFTHNAAIAMAVLGPIALLLPTRGSATKSTLQNALLGGAAFWGFNQLAEDYTGKSITARSAERWGAMLGVSFPSFSFSSSSSGGAGQGKEEEKEKENQKKKETESSTSLWLPTERAVRNKELMEAERRRRAEAEGRPYKGKDTRGLWERLWMGGEEEGWKEKRLEEERKALESGKGYGGLIMDQVREVWGGKDKSGREEGDGKGKGEGKKE
ncbi:uncharacterized protein THITE_2106850 [Thermothielavioides terrestris NRRL 8126]|uniref:Rhomboid family membrane protein n=1 Tax=Thermothielavioides terrestris (strain ATCC 38088 / NRRL 8126) TaxID=578455 RepID=G2QRW0_THETT|nr:uncharacterized protein THITE_2106850 [Thermothielavioides terrestris NRRL 8126]AEO62547.1 hypothetical protein THITE_2106850 [Thermothielavioides terrestris NRRL 8126]